MLDQESRSLSQSSPSQSEEDDEASMLLEPEPQGASSNLPLQSAISSSSSGISTNEISKTSIAATSDTPVPQERETQTVLPTQPTPTPTSQLVHAVENRKVSAVRQKEFACGCCAEEDVSLESAQADDLGRHMDDTHHSLAGPSYMNLSTGAYQQQQPFGYDHPMQYMFNTGTMQPQQQQHNVADWSDPMQWTNFDGEDNKRLM
ncbi:uncharacterized protein Triagg1_10581 [Trichoderma aggressivum f. europaeum]|uniref:Uncharacterized protein n=1 Tax=Trichoderma aggressivum f. europaeum TaxID=173218 RepID=A0AAE1I5M0_9HYPO|nr:hypothetical protein Triagg1_10581 [Trichoderma aggressivum f. europaeum]